eukprot:CAMPEP_0174386702 /NCGR_PEP_ID=MMETSP0811_2-20130205/127454_1 /TAXON_ID=73025 ORGANISM="Eutreptiella gymnastica-like, Strain CCMP1594" /NCGR_SAMPLE_ID=MMETSP0811_2 /ASSEMBLY_ACC=CAM_ASM_000667 /LENGTH=53 /DNA_ID=CAMNT_0015541461 /DNA_START=773 /DNA_END=934 /DNA_ORIENTATION=+
MAMGIVFCGDGECLGQQRHVHTHIPSAANSTLVSPTPTANGQNQRQRSARGRD